MSLKKYLDNYKGVKVSYKKYFIKGLLYMGNITKKVRFEEMRNIFVGLNKPELVEFVDHELELIEKKAMSRKVDTSKRKTENNAIAKIIVEAMKKTGKPSTITELLKESSLASYTTEKGLPLSNQKVSAILKTMLRTEENPNGTIIRTTDKKSVFFSIAE